MKLVWISLEYETKTGISCSDENFFAINISTEQEFQYCVNSVLSGFWNTLEVCFLLCNTCNIYIQFIVCYITPTYLVSIMDGLSSISLYSLKYLVIGNPAYLCAALACAYSWNQTDALGHVPYCWFNYITSCWFIISRVQSHAVIFVIDNDFQYLLM